MKNLNGVILVSFFKDNYFEGIEYRILSNTYTNLATNISYGKQLKYKIAKKDKKDIIEWKIHSLYMKEIFIKEGRTHFQIKIGKYKFF